MTDSSELPGERDSELTSDLPGGWGPALEDLAQRRAAARAMGGAERLAKRFGAAIGEGAVRALQTMPTVR